jgi:hypothetical protein
VRCIRHKINPFIHHIEVRADFFAMTESPSQLFFLRAILCPEWALNMNSFRGSSQAEPSRLIFSISDLSWNFF